MGLDFPDHLVLWVTLGIPDHLDFEVDWGVDLADSDLGLVDSDWGLAVDLSDFLLVLAEVLVLLLVHLPLVEHLYLEHFYPVLLY